MPDTLKAQHIARLTKGFVLYSDMGRILCSVTEDTVGWHDPLGGTLSAAHLGQATYTRLSPSSSPLSACRRPPPVYAKHWEIGVTYGPHGAPDFFTDADMATFFTTDYRVHYNSDRTGVGLIGPKPAWARQDGGEAGLHPSNIHDNAYAVGTVDFTGDMPIILGPDGPSCGGFVCPATIVAAERWKMGQLKAGDTVRFTRLSDEPAILKHSPGLVIRADGDQYLLVEFGENKLDFELSLKAHSLRRQLKYPGLIDLTPGIRSLQIHYDTAQLTRGELFEMIDAAQAHSAQGQVGDTMPSRIVHLPLSWDDPSTRDAIQRDQLEFFGDTEAQKLYQTAIAKLEAQGGEKVEIDYAPFRDAAAWLYQGPWVAERLAAIEEFIHLRGGEMHPVVRGIINGASKHTAVDSYRALYRLGELKRDAEAEWRKMDVLFLPTTGSIYKIADVEADPIRLNTNLGYYTNFVNLFDLAALAIPAGFRPNGLPFGTTLTGPAFSDRALIALAGLPAKAAPSCISVAVVGAHLSGQPLNSQLTERGARLIKTCRSAKNYRLYALANTKPPKPGLVRVEGFAGPGIELEVWAIPTNQFGSFVGLIPAPLGIGTVTLDDASTVKGFICEPVGLNEATEITHHASWRNYLRDK